MKRYQALLGPIVLALVAWAAGWRYCVANEDRGCDKPTQDVVAILPLYSLILFGCYALAKIGMGLMSFKDCSEDAGLLDEDIQAAKADLTRRGFRFT